MCFLVVFVGICSRVCRDAQQCLWGTDTAVSVEDTQWCLWRYNGVGGEHKVARIGKAEVPAVPSGVRVPVSPRPVSEEEELAELSAESRPCVDAPHWLAALKVMRFLSHLHHCRDPSRSEQA